MSKWSLSLCLQTSGNHRVSVTDLYAENIVLYRQYNINIHDRFIFDQLLTKVALSHVRWVVISNHKLCTTRKQQIKSLQSWQSSWKNYVRGCVTQLCWDWRQSLAKLWVWLRTKYLIITCWSWRSGCMGLTMTCLYWAYHMISRLWEYDGNFLITFLILFFISGS